MSTRRLDRITLSRYQALGRLYVRLHTHKWLPLSWEVGRPKLRAVQSRWFNIILVEYIIDANCSGYAMQTAIMDRQSLGQCKSTISPSETLSYFTAGTVGPWTMTSTVAGPSGATVVGIQLNGYNFGESIASSTSESSTPTPATNGSTPYTVSLVPTSTASSGLSSGAKIGLGVAIPLVVVGLCLVAGFLLYRRRNSKSPPVATTSAMEISRDDAKYDPTYGQMHQKYYQLPPSELHAPPPELPASQPVEPVYELGNSIHVR